MDWLARLEELGNDDADECIRRLVYSAVVAMLELLDENVAEEALFSIRNSHRIRQGFEDNGFLSKIVGTVGWNGR